MSKTAQQLINECERAARAVSGGALNKDAFIGALQAQIKMLVDQQTAPAALADEFTTVIPFGDAQCTARYVYNQGEARRLDEPGCASSVELRGLFVGSADLLDGLRGDQIESIESGLLAEHEACMPLAMRKAA